MFSTQSIRRENIIRESKIRKKSKMCYEPYLARAPIV